MVKVSVVVPVYNAESYLSRCIESITSQTLKDIELLCIDDGSTDGSWGIIQEFASKDKRIKAIRQQNSGVYVARNKAIETAKGEYIGFVDSDDWVDADYFENLYETAKAKEADIAKAYVKTEASDGFIKSKIGINTKDYDDHYNVRLKALITTNKLNNKDALWVAIYNRSNLLKNEVSFPKHIRTGSDKLFNIETGYYANKIVYANTRTYYRRVVREDSLMTSFVYTSQGLLDRAFLILELVEFLNSKQDYEKSIYVEHVANTTVFLTEHLKLSKNISKQARKKIASILISCWEQVKYKQEVIDSLRNLDPDYAESLDTPKNLRKYILGIQQRSASKNNQKLKSVAKRAAKAVLPRRAIEMYKKYKQQSKNQE